MNKNFKKACLFPIILVCLSLTACVLLGDGDVLDVAVVERLNLTLQDGATLDVEHALGLVLDKRHQLLLESCGEHDRGCFRSVSRQVFRLIAL